MQNMNLLNNIFDSDNMKVINKNRKYCFILLLFIAIIGMLLLIKKDCYYTNYISVIDNEIVLFVDYNYINTIKNGKTIILDKTKCDYSIKKIEKVDDIFLVNINFTMDIKNIKHNNYKIYLGKERIFDYIIRMIKK